MAVVNDAFRRRFLGTDASLGRELYFGEIQANAPGLQIASSPDTKYHAVAEGSVLGGRNDGP